MIGWRNRRPAAPSTADELRASGSAHALAIRSLKSEWEEIQTALPQLVMDPDLSAQAEARLTEIGPLISFREKAIVAIEAELPEAEKRDRIADITERLNIQRKASEKFSRSLEQRFRKWAKEGHALQSEISADNETCERLSREARDVGLIGVWSAEYTLRHKFKFHDGFDSLTNAVIPSWESGTSPSLWPGYYGDEPHDPSKDVLYPRMMEDDRSLPSDSLREDSMVSAPGGR